VRRSACGLAGVTEPEVDEAPGNGVVGAAANGWAGFWVAAPSGTGAAGATGGVGVVGATGVRRLPPADTAIRPATTKGMIFGCSFRLLSLDALDDLTRSSLDVGYPRASNTGPGHATNPLAPRNPFGCG
jgi:hypothetical protein